MQISSPPCAPKKPHIWLHALHITSSDWQVNQSSYHDMTPAPTWARWCHGLLSALQEASPIWSPRVVLQMSTRPPQRLRLSWSKWQNLQGFFVGKKWRRKTQQVGNGQNVMLSRGQYHCHGKFFVPCLTLLVIFT